MTCTCSSREVDGLTGKRIHYDDCLGLLLAQVDGFLGLIVHRGDVDHDQARELLDRVKVHTRTT